jgi:DNA-binding response OmpR family regulator
MKTRVLVVDDDRDHREMLRAMLELKGFGVAEAGDAMEALAAASKSRPDLILSDVAMPKLSGFQLCKKLKNDARTKGVPVILMSGERRDEREQAEGIEIGADDYLIKPFTPRLLLAKLSAVLRRFAAPDELGEILETEGLTLDVETRRAKLRGKEVALTRKEFDLMLTLIRKRGRVVSVAQLLESVWGYDPNDYSDPHTVETHVSSLRRKLGSRFAKRIETVPTRGYRFNKA